MTEEEEEENTGNVVQKKIASPSERAVAAARNVPAPARPPALRRYNCW